MLWNKMNRIIPLWYDWKTNVKSKIPVHALINMNNKRIIKVILLFKSAFYPLHFFVLLAYNL